LKVGGKSSVLSHKLGSEDLCAVKGKKAVSRFLPLEVDPEIFAVMSSLSQRLKELQVPGETAKFDFSHLSFSQLEETKVDFGQAHVGRTYREMWLNHQVSGTRIPVHKGVPSSVKIEKPKAKAWPKKLAQPPNETIPVWDATEMEEFEMYGDEIEAGMSVVAATEGPSPNVAQLEARMLSMENALSQILLALENIQPATASESRIDPTDPTAPNSVIAPPTERPSASEAKDSESDLCAVKGKKAVSRFLPLEVDPEIAAASGVTRDRSEIQFKTSDPK
ncbi:unnamed protein product, partial [Cladocopium goreaui]